jgi:hypothetical protein
MTISEWCPTCGANIVMVTRGIPSMGTCSNGHKTDRRDVLRRPPADPVAQELAALRAENARLRTDAQAAVALAYEAAAKKLEARAELLVQDEGSWEPDTNVTNLPEWAQSECEVLEESAGLIRALAPVDGLAMVEALRGALVEARDAAHSMAHDEYDGVWSEQDFSDYTPLADAALAALPAKEGGKPAPRTDYENSCPDCGPICSC